MAKIQNPQDQGGVNLINQTTFDNEVALREAADTAETTRATGKESELEASISAEAQRSQAIDNELIASLKHSLSTNTLTNNIYNQTVRQPSAINLHHSVLPIGKIKSIEIPDAGISTPYYLNIKVVDGTTDNVVDYTSLNASTAKWEFDNFINNGFETDIYYKLVLTNTPAGTLQYFGTSFPYNNINIKNCGFGGNWPEPNTNLNQESGIKGLPKINFEYLPSVADEVQTVKDSLVAEKEARIIVEEILDERITSIEGTIVYNTLSEQPSTSVQWTAIEFTLGEVLNNIIDKEIRSISINVTNTVTKPHFLAIFDTHIQGRKDLLGISKATTWNAGETAIFKFSSPVIIPDKFELFLLNEPVSEGSSDDFPLPDNYIESYAASDTQNYLQNYRKPNGTWSNNDKRSFYLTFNFVDDKITKITEIVADHLIDNERHTTSNERNNWNGHLGDNDIHITSSDKEKWNKASTDSNEALTTIQKYISTDEVLTPTSESIILSDTTNVVFNLSNDDNIILISYVPFITADIDSTVSINNNQITFTLSKKDTTQIGENYFVLEVVYIDKNLKQVKRAFSYITVTIE